MNWVNQSAPSRSGSGMMSGLSISVVITFCHFSCCDGLARSTMGGLISVGQKTMARFEEDIRLTELCNDILGWKREWGNECCVCACARTRVCVYSCANWYRMHKIFSWVTIYIDSVNQTDSWKFSGHKARFCPVLLDATSQAAVEEAVTVTKSTVTTLQLLPEMACVPRWVRWNTNWEATRC